MKPATNTISLQNIKRGTINTPGATSNEVDEGVNLGGDEGGRKQNASRKILSSTNNQNLKSVNKDLK